MDLLEFKKNSINKVISHLFFSHNYVKIKIHSFDFVLLEKRN